MAAGDVQDAEPGHAERDALVRRLEGALVVRAAMAEGGRHRRQQLGLLCRAEPGDPGDAAHP